MNSLLKIKVTEISIKYNDTDKTMSRKRRYENGPFVPTFKDAHLALSTAEDLTAADHRVLHYIIGILDDHNAFLMDPETAADYIGIHKKTVIISVKKLAKMHIICADRNDKLRCYYGKLLLNPLVGYVGNTRELDKEGLPHLVSLKGQPLLINAKTEPVNEPYDINNISFEDELSH